MQRQHVEGMLYFCSNDIHVNFLCAAYIFKFPWRDNRNISMYVRLTFFTTIVDSCSFDMLAFVATFNWRFLFTYVRKSRTLFDSSVTYTDSIDCWSCNNQALSNMNSLTLYLVNNLEKRKTTAGSQKWKSKRGFFLTFILNCWYFIAKGDCRNSCQTKLTVVRAVNSSK